jgi:uncharacterized protein YndB with AHSA1/START domain
VTGPLFESTATFTEEGRKTRVDVVMVFESAELRDRVAKQYGAVEGLHDTLAHLGEAVAEHKDDKPFVISRTFDAPRDVVFRVWTEGDHLKNWFGPKGATTLQAKNDLRPGGLFHYQMRMPDGSTILWARWQYLEISKPDRLVFITSFSDEKGGLTHHPFAEQWPLQLLTTVTFVERSGKTTVTVDWIPYNATEDEWRTFDSGRDSMTMGWSGTFERLDTYVGSRR